MVVMVYGLVYVLQEFCVCQVFGVYLQQVWIFYLGVDQFLVLVVKCGCQCCQCDFGIIVGVIEYVFVEKYGIDCYIVDVFDQCLLVLDFE